MTLPPSRELSTSIWFVQNNFQPPKSIYSCVFCNKYGDSKKETRNKGMFWKTFRSTTYLTLWKTTRGGELESTERTTTFHVKSLKIKKKKYYNTCRWKSKSWLGVKQTLMAEFNQLICFNSQRTFWKYPQKENLWSQRNIGMLIISYLMGGMVKRHEDGSLARSMKHIYIT